MRRRAKRRGARGGPKGPPFFFVCLGAVEQRGRKVTEKLDRMEGEGTYPGKESG